MKKILHLNLKSEYFNDIKNGKKDFEYREYNDHWMKRLSQRHYDEVHFKCGYPKKDDTDKIIIRKYVGYVIKEIKHKHFFNEKENDLPIKVFAIFTKGYESY